MYLMANCRTRGSASVLMMRPKLALPSVTFGIAQVRAVGQVERFGAQLDSLLTGKPQHARQREVEVPERRPAQETARCIAP